MEQFLRLDEAAKLIGFSQNTFRRWLRSGNGPVHVKTPGGTYLFRISDLEVWQRALKFGRHMGITAPWTRKGWNDESQGSASQLNVGTRGGNEQIVISLLVILRNLAASPRR